MDGGKKKKKKKKKVNVTEDKIIKWMKRERKKKVMIFFFLCPRGNKGAETVVPSLTAQGKLKTETGHDERGTIPQPHAFYNQ